MENVDISGRPLRSSTFEYFYLKGGFIMAVMNCAMVESVI